MYRIIIFLFILGTLSVSFGCAAATAPAPEASPAEPADAAPAGPAMSETRQAPAPAPAPASGNSVTNRTRATVAPGFRRCIDGVDGFGPVKLGMHVSEVKSILPGLDIDNHDSSVLSAHILSLCKERVWDYKLRFDDACRVYYIHFTGPRRMEQTVESICRSRSTPSEEDRDSPFKWRCTMGEAELSIIPHERNLNIYNLYHESAPQDGARCLLPRYWD